MTIGTAYGFFHCRASQRQIEAELPTIRGLAQTPNALELSVMESLGLVSLKHTAGLLGDSALQSLAQQAQDEGMSYVMQANLPLATNRQTADELATIINQTYQSPLYQKDEPFAGAIVYKEGNDYVFRE